MDSGAAWLAVYLYDVLSIDMYHMQQKGIHIALLRKIRLSVYLLVCLCQGCNAK